MTRSTPDASMPTCATVMGRDEAANTGVRIPGHALDCARMASGEYNITELLSGEISTGTLSGDSVMPVQVPAHSARIYRFTRQ